jgi:hypothetical protein
LREQALGGDHPTVISSINNLAALYVARGALDDAEPLLQRAMAVTIKRVEASQADLAVNLNNLVRLYVKRGDYSRAEPMLTQLLAMKRPLGPEHPEVAAVLVTLAKLRQSMAQPDAAERIWRRVLAVRERTLPANDTTIAATLDGLADACGAQGRLADELEMRERSLAIREVAQGPDHPSLPAIRTRVAELRLIAPPKVIDPAGSAPQRVSSPVNAPRRSSGANANVFQGPIAPTIVTNPERARLSNPGTTVLPSSASIALPAGRTSAPAKRASAEMPPERASGEAPSAPLPMATPAESARVSGAVVPEAARVSGAVVPEAARVSGAVVPETARVSGAVVPEAGRVSGSASRSQDIELSVSPTPSGPASAPVAQRRQPELSEIATRKRGFHLSADRAAADLAQPVKVVNPGRGKKIAIAIAAVLAIAAVVLFTFGRDMLGGLLGEPSTPAVATSPAPADAAHPASAPAVTPPAGGAQSAGAGTSHGTATTVANPSAVPARAAFQTSVTPASAKSEPARAKASAAQASAAAAKPADATDALPPVPTVNVDAATHSIDEATKATPQKPKASTPF